MPWSDQDPPATDVILSASVVTGSGQSVHVEFDCICDKDGTSAFRATAGNLFGSEEIARSKSLESVLRTTAKKAAEV